MVQSLLSKKLINLLLNNRMMSCSHLDIKLPEVMEQGRMRPKLKMVTPNHIKHKLVWCNASPLIKNLKCIPTWKAADVDDGEAEEAEDSGTSGVPTPMASFSFSSAELVETLPPGDFLPLGWASFPHSKWGLLAKDIPLGPGTDPDIGLFFTVKWNPVCGLALPPLLGGKDWDKPREDWWCACARDQLIWPYRQASLGGITSLRLWRKGNCEAHTSWCCLETELNRYAKMQAEFPTHLETVLFKMSWTLRSNSHTSDTGITPPSASGSKERVSTRTTLRWEMSCSVSRVAWAVAPTPVWKSERLISLPVGRIQGDVIWWSRGPESKGCRMARQVMNQFRCWHLGSQRHRGKKSPSLAL